MCKLISLIQLAWHFSVLSLLQKSNVYEIAVKMFYLQNMRMDFLTHLQTQGVAQRRCVAKGTRGYASNCCPLLRLQEYLSVGVSTTMILPLSSYVYEEIQPSSPTESVFPTAKMLLKYTKSKSSILH